MSKQDYEVSKQIDLHFAVIDCTDIAMIMGAMIMGAMIMGAMRRADSDTLIRLKHVFPDIWYELQDRYNAPQGWLSSDLYPFLAGLEYASYCFICGLIDDNNHLQVKQ